MINFNLIRILVALSLIAAASADHLLDNDIDADDLIAYIGGHDAEELDYEVEEAEHHDSDAMENGLQATSDELGHDNNEMHHKVADIDVLELGEVLEARRDDELGYAEDGFHPHFEALGAGYGRAEQNMYNRGKPKRSKSYSKPVQRQPIAEAESQAPTETPAPPTKAPFFDDFNNSKPQNDGNCLHAVNKERQAAGVPELINNQTLVDLAAKHTAYMAAAQTISHDGFWSYRFDAVPAGVIGVGELVVSDETSNTPNGPAKRAVDRWIGSIEHKALLLRPDMFIMGCSTALGSDGRFYATAIICSK